MNTLTISALVVLVTACSGAPRAEEGAQAAGGASPNTQIHLASEVQWEQLNPARGDKSPRAATLWGDRKGAVATGFLVRFVDGFESPPHLHNVAYRGVVIRGQIHNDDPSAEEMWMPTGSFWTQPEGGVHITSAKGEDTVAYIEIEQGPYLVLPTEKAFEGKQKPVNIDASNIVWQPVSSTHTSAEDPYIAHVWGKPWGEHLNGALLKWPAGSTVHVRGNDQMLRAVVIEGGVRHPLASEAMAPGGHLVSEGDGTHRLTCEAKPGCLVYIRARGRVDVTRP
ncbi:MAG: DUF4437 domain-containing protein [Bradymonadia bacterium]